MGEMVYDVEISRNWLLEGSNNRQAVKQSKTGFVNSLRVISILS